MKRADAAGLVIGVLTTWLVLSFAVAFVMTIGWSTRPHPITVVVTWVDPLVTLAAVVAYAWLIRRAPGGRVLPTLGVAFGAGFLLLCAVACHGVVESW